MPTQIMRITRAPEATPINPQELRSLLLNARKDSEWQVFEPPVERLTKCPHDECNTFYRLVGKIEWCKRCGAIRKWKIVERDGGQTPGRWVEPRGT